MTRSSAARWVRSLIATMPDYPEPGWIILNADDAAARLRTTADDDATAALRTMGGGVTAAVIRNCG